MEKMDRMSGAALAQAMRGSGEENEEKKKDELICPRCGNPLIKKMLPGQGRFFVHEGKTPCKAKFKNLREIEEERNEKKDAGKAEETSYIPKMLEGQAPKPEKKIEEKKEEMQAAPAEGEGVKEPVSAEPEIVASVTKSEYEDGMGVFPLVEKTGERPAAPEKPPEKNRLDKNPDSRNSPKQESRLGTKMKPLDKSKLGMREMREDEDSRIKRAYIIKKQTAPPAEPEQMEGVKEEKKQERPVPAEKEIPKERPKEAAPPKPTGPEPEEEEDDEYGQTELLGGDSVSGSQTNYPKLTSLSTGEIFDIDKPVYKIGKKKDCSLRLVENKTVSRTHAAILVKNGTCYIKDLGSTNGTFLEGMEIPKETEVEIKDGQSVMFADEEFIFNHEA